MTKINLKYITLYIFAKLINVIFQFIISIKIPKLIYNIKLNKFGTLLSSIIKF